METFNNVPFYIQGEKGRKIGIIVLQEWWGLNDHIKAVNSQFAKDLNALCVSPDLYRGSVAEKPQDANHLMENLDWPGAISDIKSMVDYLKSQGCEKVGCIGFCLGGALTIATACNVQGIDAGVCFYGIPNGGKDILQVKCPMQYHFGDLDKSTGFSDMAAVDALSATLTKSEKFNVCKTRHEKGSIFSEKMVHSLSSTGLIQEFHQYADADHAFMNSSAPAYPFNETAAALATSLTYSFLQNYLNI